VSVQTADWHSQSSLLVVMLCSVDTRPTTLHSPHETDQHCDMLWHVTHKESSPTPPRLSCSTTHAHLHSVHGCTAKLWLPVASKYTCKAANEHPACRQSLPCALLHTELPGLESSTPADESAGNDFMVRNVAAPIKSHWARPNTPVQPVLSSQESSSQSSHRGQPTWAACTQFKR
jgi:hypothetical protein